MSVIRLSDFKLYRERSVSSLEAKQRMINDAIRSYVDAKIACEKANIDFAKAVMEFAEALREVMKE
jgi:hypothetical protein